MRISPPTMIRVQTLEIPEGLKDCLKNYIAQCYGLQPNDRLFPYKVLPHP